MNRSSLIIAALLSGFLCLGASGADGYTYGDDTEPRSSIDRPTALDVRAATRNHLGSEDYDLRSDMVPVIEPGGGSSRLCGLIGHSRLGRLFSSAVALTPFDLGFCDQKEKEENAGSVVVSGGDPFELAW